MPSRQHHDEFETNQFLGKELQYFSQAGFDLDRIHIKVSLVSASHW
jgi:phosphoenolpyruvate carboxykinase (ATP)